jgi:hypothetical protein
MPAILKTKKTIKANAAVTEMLAVAPANAGTNPIRFKTRMKKNARWPERAPTCRRPFSRCWAGHFVADVQEKHFDHVTDRRSRKKVHPIRGGARQQEGEEGTDQEHEHMQRKRCGHIHDSPLEWQDLPLVSVDDVMEDEFREIARTQSLPTPFAKRKASMTVKTIIKDEPVQATKYRSDGNCQRKTEKRIKEAINRILNIAIGMPIPLRFESCQSRCPSQMCGSMAPVPRMSPRVVASRSEGMAT